jgi:hypothetical protein
MAKIWDWDLARSTHEVFCSIEEKAADKIGNGHIDH